MSLTWKQKQIILNKLGYPTRGQIKKLKTILKYNYKLLDESYASKQPHELTLDEFISVYFIGYLEKDIDWPKNPSFNQLLQTPKARLEFAFEKAKAECTSDHTDFVQKALKDKLPGISPDTLRDLEFKRNNMKLVRSYCKKFKLDLY